MSAQDENERLSSENESEFDSEDDSEEDYLKLWTDFVEKEKQCEEIERKLAEANRIMECQRKKIADLEAFKCSRECCRQAESRPVTRDNSFFPLLRRALAQPPPNLNRNHTIAATSSQEFYYNRPLTTGEVSTSVQPPNIHRPAQIAEALRKETMINPNTFAGRTSRSAVEENERNFLPSVKNFFQEPGLNYPSTSKRSAIEEKRFAAAHPANTVTTSSPVSFSKKRKHSVEDVVDLTNSGADSDEDKEEEEYENVEEEEYEDVEEEEYEDVEEEEYEDGQ
ncbi:unnamed protein product [Larinioides sclopetarius]|uniref:Uncharacterized protein n=1 Tax=Larinioides sclopetarius TaxID=280406 RepID=A0AAV2AG85_9ARAC